MRLIGNSKFGQNRPLVPYDGKSYTIADTLIELNPLNTKGKYNSVDMVEFISVEKDPLDFLKKIEPEQVGDNLVNISKKKFMKDFLTLNPWFQLDLPNKKLRRIDDGIRRPCLVNPNADHGTENMSINQYGSVIYVQCFQHKGKYKIPGQKEKKKIPIREKNSEDNLKNSKLNLPKEYPTKKINYYWLDLISDIQYLNSLELDKEEYYELLYPKINQVICNITDLQCYMIRSSKSEPNQLQKSLPHCSCVKYMDLVTNPDGKKIHMLKDVPFKDIFYRYNQNNLIYNYESRTFDPNPNFNNPKVVNTWSGFKTENASTFEDEGLQKIIYHFRDVWCAGNQEHYDWLINCWFKPFFENPHILTGTAIVLWSEQGAGKNIVIDEFLIPFIFGETQSSSITGLSRITQKHNTIIQDKIFCNVNELPRLDVNGKNRDMFDAIKGLLTDKYITIEPKGIAAYKIPNYTRYIFCSNHKESLFIESGDRRFLCLEVSSKHKGDFEYFKTLKQSMTQSTANSFFKYCLEYQPQTEGLDTRKIPMTNLKSDMIKNCSSSPEQFCLEIKDYIKLFDDTKFEDDTPKQHKYEELEIPHWMRNILDSNRIISGIDLYNNYREFCDDNGFKPYSNTKFGLIVKSHFEKRKTMLGAKYTLN